MTTDPPLTQGNDDAMQNVMDEAQQLMDSLGVSGDDLDGELSESIVIDGFAIDSDEDETSANVLLNKNTTETTTTTTAASTLNTTTTVPKEDSLEALNTPLSIESNGASKNSDGGIQLQEEQVAPTEPLHPLHEDVLVSPPTPPTPTSTLSTIPSSNSAPSFDFKAKTTMFASNLATFAQKAASQVADQVTTATTTAGTAATMTPIPMQEQPSSLVKVEMDNEQKAKLIQQHVGELLPGERVIMFLANLVNVSDSSKRAEYHSNWCCCMTYYRMLLFPTSSPTTTKETIPPEWNPHVWSLPLQESPLLLQIPLASIDKVEKSVYSTSTNHALMGLVIYG
jgi:hypothetical protein